MPRVLLVGWDGADWRILDPLLDAGALPSLKALIARGRRGVLRSTIPTHSWSAWPSFLTGVEPPDHGVYDILEGRPGGGRMLPVTFHSIRERTFLSDLTATGRETVMVNVPLTFPPPAIKGKLVAGGVLPKWRPFTHPEGLADELARAGAPFPINGMSWTTFRHRPEPFLAEVMEVTRARIRATEHLVDTTDWDLFCAVFVATDRVQHCLSNFVAPDHPDYPRLSKDPLAERVRDVYRLLDDALGALVARARDDDLVLFISDHGFRSCTRAVHMDHVLRRLGFLEFSASRAVFGPMQWGPMRALARRVYDRLGLHGRVPLPQSVNWPKTRAYTSVRSTGEGVSVNLAGRELNGIVDPADFERVRDEVAAALASFVDPATGRRPVGRVLRREEVFKGRHLARAPDLLLEPAEGYSLTHARSAVEPADWLSGDHRMDGVIVAAGPGVRPDALGEPAHLIDVAPTVLAALGAPSSISRTGRVLTELVGDRAASGPGPGAGPDQERGDLEVVGAEEAREMEEHLRGLGYLE